MKNTIKISLLVVILIISLLIIILNISTFSFSGNTDKAKAFDVGQMLGILIWASIATFSGLKLKKIIQSLKRN